MANAVFPNGKQRLMFNSFRYATGQGWSIRFCTNYVFNAGDINLNNVIADSTESMTLDIPAGDLAIDLVNDEARLKHLISSGSGQLHTFQNSFQVNSMVLGYGATFPLYYWDNFTSFTPEVGSQINISWPNDIVGIF